MLLLSNPPQRAGYDTRSVFKLSTAGLNSEFSFCLVDCHNKIKEPILPFYLPIAERKIVGFILVQILKINE